MDIERMKASIDQATASLRDDPIKHELSDTELFLLVEAAHMGLAATLALGEGASPEQRASGMRALVARMEHIQDRTAFKHVTQFSAVVSMMINNRFQPMLDGAYLGDTPRAGGKGEG